MKKMFFAVIMMLSTSAFANGGDAGCGLGTMIIQKNSKLLQLLAITTNHSFFSQELGITFGTSGCSANGIVMNEKEVQYFVEVNHDDLQREIAKGQGEKLSQLADLTGCGSYQGMAAFGKFTQKSFTNLYPTADTSSVEFVSHLKDQMNQNVQLQNVCFGS